VGFACANWTYLAWGSLTPVFCHFYCSIKNRSNMEMVQLQWNFASAKEILHIFLHFFIGLFGLIFFRAKSITDAVLYIKRILQTEVSAQYLSNERYNYELPNDRAFLLWSNGSRFKEEPLSGKTVG
jgi:D-alanyl-lipoteichoic acid acyltransferase DltB (MBOAT superfamily)